MLLFYLEITLSRAIYSRWLNNKIARKIDIRFLIRKKRIYLNKQFGDADKIWGIHKYLKFG